jgi:hypothetical protein
MREILFGYGIRLWKIFKFSEWLTFTMCFVEILLLLSWGGIYIVLYSLFQHYHRTQSQEKLVHDYYLTSKG